MHYLIVSVAQGSRLSWLPLAQSLSHGCMNMLARTAVILRLGLGKVLFLTHSHGCCQASGPPWLLSHLGFSQHGGWLLSEWASKRVRGCIPRWKPQLFYYLILEVTSQDFCPILFVRKQSLGAAHAQKEGITQGHEHQEVGIIETMLVDAHHRD